MSIELTLYQPDIPQNTGTLLRLAACLGVPMNIIEPCGFLLTDRSLKRAGMDYLDLASVQRHLDWETYNNSRNGRLILLTTTGNTAYCDFRFHPDDHVMLGRESAGVPQEVHAAADARLVIPMQAGRRSINVAIAGAMVLGEALRQTNGFAVTEQTTKNEESQ
ncbi:tRNA (cytidine/uridine-2'-O-)-methyltransferase [Limibacillus sp. MBR-115]|jgi:tRNA (cytidine/uridine-2'-O-)-methyltransferase